MQDSAELSLPEIQEQSRIALVSLLIQAFAISGLHWPVRGIDRPAFWRATNIEKEKFEMPKRDTLWQWCCVFGGACGRDPEEWRLTRDIMRVAGHQTPKQVRAALKETAKHYAVKRPRTDELRDLTNKSYREQVRKAVQGLQQFKKPHSDTY